MENILGYDLTHELNEFNQPKILSSIELVKNVILFILFTEPGQYPSLPMIGMDIKLLLHDFYDEINVDELASTLMDQCGALGYYFDNGNISVSKFIYNKQPSLSIRVSGQPSYPPGYITDKVNTDNDFLIGVTFDEFDKLIMNMNS